jgi:D-3-phosphoglycerate dehydrogenase / 2-oxoglutarate reductase
LERVVVIGDNFIGADPYLSSLSGLNLKVSSVNLSGTKEEQHSAQQLMEVNGPNSVKPDSKVIEAVNEANIITAHFAPMGESLIAAAPNLKLIAVARAGLENVDIKAATQRGIGVVPSFGRNANAVAELQIGLMLAEIRNISRADASIKSGGWRKEFPGARIEIGGATVGMIGFGHVGRAMAKKLAGFNPKILVYDPYANKNDLIQYDVTPVAKIEELFRESDFVICQARLSSETERFINKRLFDLMKPTSYFINVSRSRLVNQKDLLDALKAGKISGAGVDVFDSEPLPQEDEFRKLDNITMTTHFGGDTEGTNKYSAKLCADAIATFLTEGKVSWAANAKELGWA